MTIAVDPRKHLKVVLVVGAAVLAVNLAFYMFAVRPRAMSYETLEASAGTLDRDVLEAEQRQSALDSYSKRLEATETSSARFRKEILGSKQDKSIEIQREISRISREFGIDPDSVSYENSDLDDDGLEKFAIDIPAEGDYQNLRKFISRIEQSKSFLIVDRVSLSSTKEGGLQLLLNIAVTTYFDAPWLKELKKSDRPERKRA